MNGCELTLEFDEGDLAVWLIPATTYGIRRAELVWLNEGFGVDDVREAIIATGWVKLDGDDLRLTRDGDSLWGKVISDVLAEMFTYFSAPGVPTSELLEIQSAVAEYEVMRESSFDIPLYAYAWLDVMVREDIADEARSAKDIWIKSKVAIEPDRYCERRVEELLSRYSQASARTAGRMAGSMATRKSDESRGSRAS